jgi:two-component system, cell cycle sensor histidine kinase and response regulator CckA
VSHETIGGIETDHLTISRNAPALLTPYARVLLELSRDPDLRLRDLALRIGLTERTVHRIVSELVESGSVERHRRGRRVSYGVVVREGLEDVAALAGLAANPSASLSDQALDPAARIQHVEAALKEAEERFRMLVEHIPAAVYIQNASGKHLYASPQIETITGYTAEEWTTNTTLWSDVIHADDRDRVTEHDRNAGEAETPFEAEYRLVRRDGTVSWLHDRCVPSRDDRGDITMWFGVVVDATAGRAAEAVLEEQLRQADKLAAVGQLAGGIAHDFNNVLTTIVGAAELLLVESGPPEDWRESIEEIRAASDRAASLTHQLLAFSRRQLLRPRIVDLNEPVRASERMLRRLIGEDIELGVSLAEEAAPVLVDPSQIDQVLVNLVINARQAMPSGGKLGISTQTVDLEEGEAFSLGIDAVGRYVRLTVTDTGEGMDPTTLSHLFEPFFTTREAGSGLGLATVYGIVKQSGGHTEVVSEIGVGTTISVFLPAVEGVPEAIQQVPEPPQRGTETLLLVEDEVAVRRLTRRALERYGYEVLEAESPFHALELAVAFSGAIDMVVTDVVMPGMNGRELVEKLRRLRPETRVLFVSGYDEGAVLGTDQLPDDVSFLPKPFTPSALHRKVREAID